MTIFTAACALVDTFVESGSFLRTEVSACDYGILDNIETSGIIIRPGVSTFESPFGYAAHSSWGFGVEGYVRDEGDVVETMSRALQMHDVLYGALVTGSLANTQTLTTTIKSITHNPLDSWFTPGGTAFLMVTANTEVKES